MKSRVKAYLILENGTVFSGSSFGCEGKVIGRAVFSTGMAGYQEVLTNPSHKNEIVCMTFPEQGCYGANSFDSESEKSGPCGFVCREWTKMPNNYRCEMTIDAFLKKRGIVGISGVDTRALTVAIRDGGACSAAIVTGEVDIKAILEELSAYAPKVTLADIKIEKSAEYKPENAKYKLALIDLGVSNTLINNLCSFGCEIKTFAADITSEEIKAFSPDGIVLSNGPFDADLYAALAPSIKAITALDIPIFAVDSGHLLLGIALGAKVEMLKFGHHGGNLPAKDVMTDRTYITAQCHSAALAESSLAGGSKLTFRSLNDGSVEGVDFEGVKAVSVQFIPDTFNGKSGTAFVYERFLALMKGDK